MLQNIVWMREDNNQQNSLTFLGKKVEYFTVSSASLEMCIFNKQLLNFTGVEQVKMTLPDSVNMKCI